VNLNVGERERESTRLVRGRERESGEKVMCNFVLMNKHDCQIKTNSSDCIVYQSRALFYISFYFFILILFIYLLLFIRGRPYVIP
jgi:hypothetical protein